MLRPADYDDIIVTIAHPWADVETTLQAWIETGPGPRPFVTITGARRRNGDPVPLDAIPLQYRNNPESRRLQRLGLLPSPWGPPRTTNPETRTEPNPEPDRAADGTLPGAVTSYSRHESAVAVATTGDGLMPRTSPAARLRTLCLAKGGIYLIGVGTETGVSGPYDAQWAVHWAGTDGVPYYSPTRQVSGRDYGVPAVLAVRRVPPLNPRVFAAVFVLALDLYVLSNARHRLTHPSLDVLRKGRLEGFICLREHANELLSGGASLGSVSLTAGLRVYDDATRRPLIPDGELERVADTFIACPVVAGRWKECVHGEIGLGIDPAERVIRFGSEPLDFPSEDQATDISHTRCQLTKGVRDPAGIFSGHVGFALEFS